MPSGLRHNQGMQLFFDPRIQHSGSYIVGPKYSMFVAYGKENKHFYNHHNYYTKIRSELNYAPLDPALIDRLMMADLYQLDRPQYDSIDGVWTPTPLLRNLIAQRNK